MKGSIVLRTLFLAMVGLIFLSAITQAQDLGPRAPQLAPTRLSSTGDSITEAFDAELPLANHWASWANGYQDFWTWLFGLTDVNSHNRRIDRNFGQEDRTNFIEAVSGSDSFDFPGQAMQAVDHQASYVTVFMGHNDICQNEFADIPTFEEYAANMRAGFEILRDGLPAGATIYVIGLVDIYQLWEVAQDKKALGIIDCEVIWAFSLFDIFPCGTMLNPLIGDTGRGITRFFNFVYNFVLQELVSEMQRQDPNHHWYFTWDVFAQGVPFEYFVSDIDCFHPSAAGQEDLAETTWNAGPFSEFQN